MGTTNKKNFGICAYCGRDGSDTRDHAPPKLLLKKPLDSHPPPVLVPAHESCNQKYLISDNKLASFLLLHSELPTYVFPIRERFLRHAKHKFQKGLIREIFNNSTELPILWPTGDKIVRLTVSGKDMQISLIRIIQALHYRLFTDQYLSSDKISHLNESIFDPQKIQTYEWHTLHPCPKYLSFHLINFAHPIFKRIWVLIFYETFAFQMIEKI